MERNNETNKEMSQSSCGQRSRNQNQYKPRQRKAETKPTHSTNVSNNSSNEIEHHQPVAMIENSGTARLNQSNASSNDDNNEQFSGNNSSRRRGQNNAWYKSDKRGSPRDGYPNQDRRYNNAGNTNANGSTEIRNGKKQHAKRANSFRSSYGRGFAAGWIGDDPANPNGPIPLSQSISSSPSPTEKQPVIAAKPNAWTDNAFPITKSFENTALKGLLPTNTEEENEMLERALQLSLVENLQQRNSYGSHPVERKSSNSSETEVFVNEVEEAKKMLQTHDFPPLSVFASHSAFLSPAVTMPPKSETVKEQHEIGNPSVNLVRKSHSHGHRENEIDRSTPEVWDRFGARPKKKAAIPAGRGFGRGRRGSEGKIGELVTSSASRSTTDTVKPKSPPNDVDLEQFESAELSSVISKSDSGFCEDDGLSVDSSSELSNLPIPVSVPQGQIVGNPTKQARVPVNVAKQSTIMSNVMQQVTVLKSATQQGTVLDDVRQQATVLDDARPQATVSDDAKQQATVSDDARQQATVSDDARPQATLSDDARQQATVSNGERQQATVSEEAIPHADAVMAGSAQIPVQMLLEIDIGETENETAEEQPQHIEFFATEIVQSDQSKDEEIRALKEELNRLKYGHHDAAHFAAPYGMMPLPVPYIVSMPYYRYPFPNMPLPIGRNDGAMFNTTFGHVPYMPNGQTICPQEMIQMQQTTIPTMCNDEASVPSPSPDDLNRLDLNSSLSPTAEVFHPKQNPPAHVRNDTNFNNQEGRKPRPKQQNYNRRGNAKNFHGQYQNNYSPRYNYNSNLPNFQAPPFQSSRGPWNSQVPLPAPTDNDHASFPFNRGYDHGPPAY